MAHEGPGREERAVQRESATEVHDGLFVLRLQRVVVADDAAGFGPEFVGLGGELGEEGELWPVLEHVQYVAVGVEVIEPVGVRGEEAAEDGFGFVKIFGVGVEEGTLGVEEGRGREDVEDLGERRVHVVGALGQLLRRVDLEDEAHDVFGQSRTERLELCPVSASPTRVDKKRETLTSSIVFSRLANSCHAPQLKG